MCVLLKIVSIISFFYLANLTSLYLKQWHFLKKKKITHFCLCTTPQFSIPGFEIAFGSTSLEFSIWLPKGCWCKNGETVFFSPMAAKVLFSHGQITNLNSIKHHAFSYSRHKWKLRGPHEQAEADVAAKKALTDYLKDGNIPEVHEFQTSGSHWLQRFPSNLH